VNADLGARAAASRYIKAGRRPALAFAGSGADSAPVHSVFVFSSLFLLLF
jgi:hypothetical protein